MSSSPPSPSFLSRLWPTLVLVLAAFGVPAATVAFFTHFVTEHPWLALGIGLLYEVVVFVLGFVGKVWQKLEGPLVERTAEWFDHWLQGIISRYRKQYYDYLRYQHRDFDMKGLSTLGIFTLELDQVFVEPRIDTTTPQQASADPIQVPQELREGNHTIWNYLAFASLRNQHLVIIGPPGSGKTTLLRHITLTLIIHRKKHHQPFPERIPHKLPILLFLRDYATAIKEHPDLSLVDAVQDHLKKWVQPNPPVGWFERQLARGRCLIMLDGLDEVADPGVRQMVVNWVERQMAAYHENRFLVTSRPFGYRSNPLSGVTVLEVRPFTTEQVENFIHQWYLANEIMSKQKDDAGVRMRARAEADAFLQQLRNTPTLFDLTVNPLLLTMIATVHRYGGELPGNRVALYTEICEVFLGKRQQARGQVLELTPAQMQLVLKPLAYHMMLKGIREIALDEVRMVLRKPLSRVRSQMLPEAFLRLVENASGLLLERENDVYSFAHLTFQEYLAAAFLVEKRWGYWLLERIGMTWWQETIRLYCAMADATLIIAACLEGDRPSVPIVELAINCDEEAREVQPDVRIRLETLLKQGVEDPDPERQHVIAGALLTKRLRGMVHLKDETYSDTSLITCAEYQVFLDEQRAHGYYLQPDHWTSYHFSPGQGNAPVLGVRSSDATAFCEWLNEREHGPWLYRLPEEGELEDGITVRLLADTGYWLKDGKGIAWAKKPLALPENVRQKSANQARTRALTGAIDLSNDLIIARNLDHELADNLYLVCNRDYASTRTHALNHGCELVAALARELDRAITYDHKLSVQLATARDLTSQLSIQLAAARDLSSAIDIDISRPRELITALNHVYELDHELARELDRARELAIASDRGHARELASDRAHRYTFRLQTRKQGISSVHNVPSIITSILDRARDREFGIVSDLDRARELAIASDRDRARDRARELAIARARTQALTDYGEKPSSRRGIGRLFRFGLARKLQEYEVDRLIESALDIHLHLVILEGRIQGELPACEGILVVKERK